MEHIQHCDALAAEMSRFSETLRRADWRVPVPTCPEWDLAGLVEHLGTIHRWAAGMVRDVAPARPGRDGVDYGIPGEVNGYAEWFAAGAADLLAALRACDPDAVMWAWGADQHARFWSRRQLHETAVHHADARVALGIEPPATVDAQSACDGIDELLDNLPSAAYFAPGVANLKGAGETIHLHATDVDGAAGEWTITLDADGFTYGHAHGKGTVAVRGSAADLFLLVYNRRSLDGDASRFEVFGDRAVIDHWLVNAAL